ncbi:MAG: acetate uptake transporter [Spirochaetia bacterium]
MRTATRVSRVSTPSRSLNAAPAAAAAPQGLANPAPLGLLGFGMTTIVLNLHNAGLFPLSTMIAGMGVFVGGFAQIVAGIMEFRKNNTFGMTAFCAYGIFWLSLVAVWTFPALGISDSSSPFTMGFYLVVWGLFTTGMFFGTLKLTRVHQFVFASLAVLFFLLAITDFTESSVMRLVSGVEGIVCGLSAFYGAIALVLNEQFGRTVLPMGKPR